MTNTRKLATIAILSALSFLLMFFDFPILPGTDFLKLEFSILPILLGLVMLDLSGAFYILLLRSLLKLVLNNQGVNTYIGLPMNIVAFAVFVLAIAFVWQKKRNIRNYLLASGLATLSMTLVMIILNYIYAVPLYAKFANFNISKNIGLVNYLLAIVTPFNILQGLAFSLAFWLLYSCLKPILKKYEK